MRKFVNQTSSGNEKAIKIGNNVPTNAVGLSWFDSNEVTPGNTVGIVDYSDLIHENKISERMYGQSQFAYADELGILRKANGSYNFQSNDISISDLPLSRRAISNNIDLSSQDSHDYAHYKYVSRHFISAPNNFSLIDENSFIEADAMSSIAIKVVDKNGFEYLDESLNRKKYRILLEPYRTSLNYNNLEVPHKVVVLLDASIPDNLSLIYDKVETNDDGSVFNLELGFSESINPIPIYEEIPEESFVIDRTTTGKKVFSIKKLDNKYSELVNQSPSNNGYQVIAPLKAFSDYRTYETFNWRVVARSRTSVNVSTIDAGLYQDTDNIARSTIKVAVLYDSNTALSNSDINPYIFRRLQSSSFNLFGYIFENPNGLVETLTANIGEKDHADYWKVDINNLDIDIREYDILAWSPNSVITPDQSRRIESFLAKSKTLILDLSNAPDDAARHLQGNLNLEADEKTVTELRVEASAVTDSNRNGAWDLVSGTDYAKDYYGIWGSINSSTSADIVYKSYKYFKNSNNSFLNIIDDPQDTENPSVARFIPYLNNSDSVSRGNILVTSFDLMPYCNAIYGLSTNQNAISQNTGNTIDPDSDIRYAGVVEGPFKLLYNTCCYALYSLAKSSRSSDERSAIYNYVSKWYPSWTMNQDALLDEEKNSLFTNISTNTTDKRYARDLLEGFDNTEEYIKQEVSSLSDYISDRINADIDNVEVFIEVTNPSVDLVNANKLSEADKISYDIPSSYQLFKVIDNKAKVYAETTAYSMSLSIPSSYGDYIIIEKPVNKSKDILLKDSLNVMDTIASYPFDLQCVYSYAVPGSEKYTEYKATLDVDFTYNLKATFYDPQTRTETGDSGDNPDVDATKMAQNTESYIDRRTGVKGHVSDVNNIFPYTGDLDVDGVDHKTAGWRAGQRGTYVNYIQWVLKQANPAYYRYNIDGYYGNATAAGVRSFQKDQAEKWVDGVVDSETKWYLAKFLIDNNVNIEPLRQISEGAYKFAAAAKKTVEAYQINTGKNYRKTSFTGVEGPTQAEDFLFFEFDSALTASVDKIVITPVSGWDNFEIVASGVGTVKNKDVENVKKNYASTGAARKVGNKFEINLSGVDASKVRAGYIQIKANKLGGKYGSLAEGYGISQIKLKGKDDGGTFKNPDYDVFDHYDEKQVDVTLDIDINDYFVDRVISADRDVTFDIKNTNELEIMNSLSKDTGKVVRFNYNGKSYSVDKTLEHVRTNGITTEFGDPQQNGYLEIILPVGGLSSLIDEDSVSYSLQKVHSAVDNSLVWDNDTMSSSGSPVSTSQSGTVYTMATSATYFSDSISAVARKSLSTGYSLRSADVNGIVYDDQRKTVDINDGVLLFCNSNGSKYGFPTYNEILSEVDQNDLEVVDTRLGTLTLNNAHSSDGMVYGFFDVIQNEFLGSRIDYIDYVDPNRDVYIAVAAIDADGDIFSDNDFIGSSGNILLRPVQVPLKYVAPVYSLVMNSPSAIKIKPMDSLMSRFDTWGLSISNGYFEKKILIDGSFNNSDWKNNYRGQKLTAVYSTSQLSLNNSSRLYGKNSVDVYNESPVLLDDKTIRLRRTPVLAWSHPTTYLSSIFGIVKPVISIEVRDSVNDPWQEIKYSEIKDINCQTGTVEFVRRIVPSDNSLIRVSYTVRSKDNFVKRVGSSPIPLNPVLDHDLISFNQPLFIYILPRELYADSSATDSVGSKVRVSDYTVSNVVQYTYDSDVFNKNSSRYNPLALLLAAVYVSDKPENIPPRTMDIRLRGGGVVQDVDVNKLINEVPEVLYNWDVYSADTEAYARGGYVIIKIPETVKDHFVDQNEIYSIIKNNLTAGVVFELQDMNGNTWS